MAALVPLPFAIELPSKTHLSVVDPIIWALFALWLYEAAGARFKGMLRFDPATALFLLCVAAAAIRFPPRMRCIKETVQMFEYFGAAWLVVRHRTRSSRDIRNILAVIMGIGSAVLAIALVQYFSAHTQDFMVCGTFANRNVLGGYLALTMPLMFSAALNAPSVAWRVWAGVLTAAGATVLLSGGAALGIAAGCFAVAAFKSRWRIAITAICAALLAVAALPRLPRNNASVLYESVRLCDEQGTMSQRYVEWQAAATMIGEFPWRGVGPDLYQENIGMYYGSLPNPPSETSEHDSQNLYLVIASTMGIPALLAFFSMLAAGMTTSFSKAVTVRTPWTEVMYCGIFGCLISYSIASVWSPLLARGLGILLALLLATVHADLSDEQEKSNWSGRRESNP